MTNVLDLVGWLVVGGLAGFGLLVILAICAERRRYLRQKAAIDALIAHQARIAARNGGGHPRVIQQ